MIELRSFCNVQEHSAIYFSALLTMPFALGGRWGPYEITAAIGVGGMGEVYRARDTKLGRDVAIKVLPAAFSADVDRIARLQRGKEGVPIPSTGPHDR